MKTFLAKKEDIQRRWLLVDADGAVLGKMAAKIATILMGKDKPIYTRHVDTGDYVVVVNASKIQLSGKKEQTKKYDYYTRFPGGHKYVDYRHMMDKKPEKVVQMAVKRMLPKNKLGNEMLKKLKIFAGSEHEHVAQQPQSIDL